MATHSSTLAWKIPWMEKPGRLQSTGSLRVRHDWATSLSLFTFIHWRRKWQPTPVFLPGESQGWEPGGLPSMGLQSWTRLTWRSSSSDWTTATALAYQHIFNHLLIEGHLTCFLFLAILNKIAINISYIISFKGSFYIYLEKVFKSIITLSYDNYMFSFL